MAVPGSGWRRGWAAAAFAAMIATSAIVPRTALAQQPPGPAVVPPAPPAAAPAQSAAPAATAAGAAARSDAAKSAYPAQPITLIAPFAAGAPMDVAARAVAAAMTQSLGVAVTVENKPGAAGVAALTRATPDGYTLGLVDVATCLLVPALDPKAPYQTFRDLRYVGHVASTELVFVARAGLPVKTLSELVKYAQDNPRKVRYPARGATNEADVVFDLFKAKAKIELVPIAGGSGDPAADLAAGRVDVDLVPIAVAQPAVASGKLRLLATASSRRSPARPDLPTAAESGFANFAATDWALLAAPAQTPQSLFLGLNAALNKALVSPAVRDKYAELGIAASPYSVGQTHDWISRENERWNRTITEAKPKKPADAKPRGMNEGASRQLDELRRKLPD